MDGNRRWAKDKGMEPIKGHEAGADTLEELVYEAKKMGIKTITVYALSTENLKERPRNEIFGLFNLIRTNFKNKFQKMLKDGIKVNILGDMSSLPKVIQNLINKVHNTLIPNPEITLNICLNYGGRKEILDAVKNIIKDKINPEKLDEQLFSKYLYTQSQPDPELLIRTGGKIRLSNYLLWQTSYSEIYFTKILWPDFSPKELKKAIRWYQDQQRNFGR